KRDWSSDVCSSDLTRGWIQSRLTYVHRRRYPLRGTTRRTPTRLVQTVSWDVRPDPTTLHSGMGLLDVVAHRGYCRGRHDHRIAVLGLLSDSTDYLGTVSVAL